MTPRQVAGLQEIVDEDKDFSLLDGFDELSEENQDKIREAVEQGHVADSDWKGVSSDRYDFMKTRFSPLILTIYCTGC